MPDYGGDKMTRVPPDAAPLTRAGWSVQSVSGAYAVAWQGATEAVFVFKRGEWHRLATRSPAPARRAS